MSNEPKEISDETWWTALGIGLFVDVLQLVLILLPLVGEILAEFIGWIAFGSWKWWTSANGINYPGKNKTFIIGLIVGLIPVINDVLPEFTMTIWYTRKGYKKQQKALAEQNKNNLIEMQKAQNQQMVNVRKVA
jgi:hypothetical protein